MRVMGILPDFSEAMLASISPWLLRWVRLHRRLSAHEIGRQVDMTERPR